MKIKIKQPHDKQRFILDNSGRFNAIRSGRRFGKTTLAQYLIADMVIHIPGSSVAYYAPTTKDMDAFWSDTKNLFFEMTTSKRDQVHQLLFAGGSSLDLWSLDNPDSSRGRAYDRIIIDEAEKVKKLRYAWEYTIRPTLIDREGDAWMFSTGKGQRTYFNRLFSDPEWTTFEFSSLDNPYLPEAELQRLKQLPSHVYAQEVMGKAVDLTDKRWLFAFDYNKHVSDEVQLSADKFLYLCFDFNVDPFICLFRQHWVDDRGIRHINFVDEIAISGGASAKDMVERIRAKAAHHITNKMVRITGDPTENKRNLIDTRNAYQIICDGLAMTWKYVDLPKISRNEDNRVLTNAIFEGMDIKISTTCEQLIYDCEFVQADNYGQKIKASRTNLAQRADALDAMSYSFDAWDWDFLRILTA